MQGVSDMIELDGTLGEGGGQIVRTALALSMLTQEPFRVTGVRKGRGAPGLKMQHLHAIKALQALSGAQADGAELGSTELTFIPKPLKAKPLSADIETAGSITLFLQAVLLPCCFADKPLKITVTGGTDVAWAMPVDYFREILVPHLRRWADIDIRTEKRGYYPKGNGTVTVRVKPRTHRNEYSTFAEFLTALQKKPKLNLAEQHNLMHIKGISHASKDLEQARVAERQAHAAQQALAAQLKCPITIRSEYADALSTGSGITLWAVFSKHKDDIDVADPVVLGADTLGEKGMPAEQAGKECAQKLIAAIQSGAAVDAHLADNLIPWMALYPPGAIKAERITPHTLTNIEVVKRFIPAQFSVDKNNLIRSFA
jgi:RNA 3'-phosphate cyclase